MKQSILGPRQFGLVAVVAALAMVPFGAAAQDATDEPRDVETIAPTPPGPGESIPYDDLLGHRARSLTAPWESSTVTFALRSGTADMTGEAGVLAEVAAAWDEVSGLSLVQGGDDSDIRIDFYTGAHGDGAAFDGPYGVLAHAVFPGPDPINGDMHFDDAETWTDALRGTAQQPIDLATVALHEFGHSLGLEHLDDPDAVMYANYGGSRRSLTDTDIAAIQSLYPLEIPFGDLQISSDAIPIVGAFDAGDTDDLQLSLGGKDNDRRFLSQSDRRFLQDNAAFDIGGSYDEFLVGDFSGDGRVDLWLHRSGPDNDRMLVSDGDGLVNQGSSSFDVRGTYDEFLVGDFSGDGRDDIWLHRSGDDNDRMLVSTGANTFDNYGSDSFDVRGSYDEYLVGDFSGDGQSDVWLYDTGSGNDRMLVSQSANRMRNYGSDSVDIGGTYDGFFVGDFSGEGGTDLHLYGAGRGGDRRLVSTGPNRMNNFGSGSEDLIGDYDRGIVGDYDGDGHDDVLLDNTGGDTVVLGEGANGFESLG